MIDYDMTGLLIRYPKLQPLKSINAPISTILQSTLFLTNQQVLRKVIVRIWTWLTQQIRLKLYQGVIVSHACILLHMRLLDAWHWCAPLQAIKIKWSKKRPNKYFNSDSSYTFIKHISIRAYMVFACINCFVSRLKSHNCWYHIPF